ncbi:MAG: FAD binding domain-containing protein [Gammaproteobacteria bacterium]|nr:FAD binding domain-containing protein [Gammaproteobacteria bacterium]
MAIPNLRDYYLPDSQQEVVDLLKRFGEGAMIVAGGTFVHGLEVRGLLEGVVALIDISRLDLRGIGQADDGTISLGAMSTLAELSKAAFVRDDPAYGAIRDALTYPPPQIRNTGTVGGCVAAAAPLYDLPAALLALDGRVRATNCARDRDIQLSNFFAGLFENTLETDELITAIHLPAPGPRTASAFLKLETNANDLAILNVAVRLTLDARGACSDTRVVLGGGVGETYVRSAGAEKLLNGKSAGTASFAEAAAAVPADIEAVSDARASAGYRRQIAEVYVRRALAIALERLG